MSLKDRYHTLRFRLLLQGVVVPLYKAEREIKLLRVAAGGLLLVAAGMGVVLHYRWTVALAQTFRIAEERQLVMSSLAVAAYGEGINQVHERELAVYRDKSLPDKERLSKFFTLDVIGLELTANQEAMKRAQSRAEVAQKELPRRATGGTLWTDSLTGEAFPIAATREQITAGLVKRRMEGPEQESFLHLLAVVSRPNAEAIPSPLEVLESSK